MEKMKITVSNLMDLTVLFLLNESCIMLETLLQWKHMVDDSLHHNPGDLQSNRFKESIL